MHTQGAVLLLIESEMPAGSENLSLKGISLCSPGAGVVIESHPRMTMEFSPRKGVTLQGLRGGDKYVLFQRSVSLL